MTPPADTLAYLRTAWALERTQLAWVRTSFAVMSAGLALDKGASALHQARLLDGRAWVDGGHAGGIALAAAAAVQLAAATYFYVRRDRALAAVVPGPRGFPAALPLSVAVTGLSAAVAVLLAVWE